MFKSYFEPNDISCITILHRTANECLAIGFRDAEGGNVEAVLAAAAASVENGEYSDMPTWLSHAVIDLVEDGRPIKVIRAAAYALWHAADKPTATMLDVQESMFLRSHSQEPMKQVVHVFREACEASDMDMLEIVRHRRKTQVKMRLRLPELKLPSAFIASCLPAHVAPAVDDFVRDNPGVMKTVGNKGVLDMVLRHP